MLKDWLEEARFQDIFEIRALFVSIILLKPSPQTNLEIQIVSQLLGMKELPFWFSLRQNFHIKASNLWQIDLGII